MTPEAIERRRDHRGDGSRVGYVGDVARRLAAGRFDVAHRRIDVGVRMQRVDHHVGAAGRKSARDRARRCCGPRR